MLNVSHACCCRAEQSSLRVHARMLLSISLTDSDAANVSASQVCMDEHKHVQHIDAWLTLCTVPGQSR